MKTMKDLDVDLALIVVALAGIVGYITISPEASQHDLTPENQHYCDMVEIHKSSGGDYGWPDYKEVYDEQC